MAWGRKKKPKDEVAAKRKKNASVPYKKCGHRRSYNKGSRTFTVICQKNRNIPHTHD